jgi:hypothetical protein
MDFELNYPGWKEEGTIYIYIYVQFGPGYGELGRLINDQ